MDAATQSLIAAFHATDTRWSLAFAGGGATAATDLLSVPGGSRTILEVAVPYHEQAVAEYLGRRPESYCSVETARAMAERARDRARWMTPGERVFGLGATASLASDRPKRGEHRIHVSIAGDGGVRSWSCVFSKGARDRAGEERASAGVVLFTIAKTLALTAPDLDLLPDERVVESTVLEDRLARWLAEDGAVYVGADGRLERSACWRDRPTVLVPGSFNPLHRAHRGLAEEAARRTGLATAFELSVANVDKPDVSLEEVRRRLTQFAGHEGVWITRAPRFTDKARLFPGAVFAVGVDTAQRLVDPRYYGGDAHVMHGALALLRNHGCRLLVAGRCGADGRFLSLDDLTIPTEARDLFAAIPGESFRVDVSSTDLRRRG